MLRRPALLLLLFALTLFLSAFLMFIVEPLIGKLIVPLLGGFPSVWNTCMVFFQAMLLAGYAYAHWTTTKLSTRGQVVLHLILLVLPFLVFPLGLYENLVPSGDQNPIPGLLLLLAVSVGLPFFVLSATAPLLQKWFAGTNHPSAKDPYFLYAASNAGSMLALLAYPVLIEPNLRVVTQRWSWTVGYALLMVLTAVCGLVFWSLAPVSLKPHPLPSTPVPIHPKKEGRGFWRELFSGLTGPSLSSPPVWQEAEEITWGQALRWVALALVPSSMMLGVTTYISTDIAAIPLLWILPLALYLLSFILVFSRLPAFIHKGLVLALPILLLLLVFTIVSELGAQKWVEILIHLGILFIVAMVCHGELVRTRPSPQFLTKFYLLMSVGGVLGGLFNALLAPLLFNSLAEYPLVLVLAAFLMPRLDDTRRRWSIFIDLAFLLVLALLSVEMFTDFPLSRKFLGSSLGQRILENGPDTIRNWIDSLAARTPLEANHLVLILTFAPPIVLCYFFVDRPVRFGLGLGILLLAGNFLWLFDGRVIYRHRSFFGLLTVKWDQSTRLNGYGGLSQYLVRWPVDLDGEDPQTGYTSLTHGHILHGMQNRDPGYRNVPLTYYHRTGPVGQLFAAFEGSRAKRQVAVIGLGTGTMACYPEKGHRLTFYEIDPKVKELSFDQRKYFSFVKDAQDRGAIVDIVLGDARLQLDRARNAPSPEKYDVIVVDAFSSDAIPVHLITREALEVYLDNLKEDGIVAFHTSNKYLLLEPVVVSLAADKGCVALVQHDYGFAKGEYPGKETSSWALVARKEEHFGKLLDDVKANSEDTTKRWLRMEVDPNIHVWSDDFSNLLQVFRWDSGR